MPEACASAFIVARFEVRVEKSTAGTGNFQNACTAAEAAPHTPFSVVGHGLPRPAEHVVVALADMIGALPEPSNRTSLLDCICPPTVSPLPIHISSLERNESTASEGMPYF